MKGCTADDVRSFNCCPGLNPLIKSSETFIEWLMKLEFKQSVFILESSAKSGGKKKSKRGIDEYLVREDMNSSSCVLETFE